MLLTVSEIRDAILMALESIRANKFRAFLTVLGVMIGVSSVIGLAALIGGLNGAAQQEIDRIGSNIIMVSRFRPDENREDLSAEDRNRPPITVGEAEAILKNCKYVDGVAPQNYYYAPGGNVAKYKNRKFSQPMFNGTWPDYIKVRDKDVSMGRFISEVDLQNRLMVCVIGDDIKRTLFEGENPVGKEIRVNGDKFRVIGVHERMESNFGNDNENRMIWIPLSTYQKLIPWEKALGLMVRATSHETVELAKDEITGVLRAYRKVPFNKPDNFALSTQEQFREFVDNFTNTIQIVMIVVTSVGLMVGGIGVMNIMLVSVTERTREIGVRKAIGAKRSNIIIQFLTEAMALSGSGGIVGIIFGVILGMALNAIFSFPLDMPFVWILIGFSVSVSVGLVSGVYPAMKAAMLDPIEALRYE